MKLDNTERIDGPTPNGGDYSIASYFDKDGIPCNRNKAFKMIIEEFKKDGTSIHRTYGFCNSTKKTNSF